MSRHVHGPQLVRKEKMRVCSCRFPTTMLTRAQDRPWGACPLVRLQPCMRVDYPLRPLLAALTARRLERPLRPLRRKWPRIAGGRPPRAAWRPWAARRRSRPPPPGRTRGCHRTAPRRRRRGGCVGLGGASGSGAGAAAGCMQAAGSAAQTRIVTRSIHFFHQADHVRPRVHRRRPRRRVLGRIRSITGRRRPRAAPPGRPTPRP